MEFLSTILTYVVPFLLMLTVLVFVHELGHFLVARKNGVKVEVFSVGFGQELWGFTDRFGTRWRLSAIPLGGYVKMFGEGDMVTGVDDTEERPMTEAEKAISFHHKSLGQRSAIVAAGPLANFLFAVLVLWGVNSIWGVPQILPVVGEVMPNTAAEAAGLEPGDHILAVNGREIALFSELTEIVSVSAGVSLDLTVERDGQILQLVAVPRTWGEFQNPEDARAQGGSAAQAQADVPPGRGLLGVRPDLSVLPTERKGVVEGLALSLEQTWFYISNILSGLGEMLVGERSAKELGGVIMIAEVSGNAAQGGLYPVLQTLVLLSINLGLINLFPVPVLDGGHLVFYAAEALRGKPLSARVQEYGFRLGLVLVLLLMLFATWNDFGRMFEKFG